MSSRIMISNIKVFVKKIYIFIFIHVFILIDTLADKKK